MEVHIEVSGNPTECMEKENSLFQRNIPMKVDSIRIRSKEGVFSLLIIINRDNNI